MDDSVLSLINTKLNWAAAITFIVYMLHSGLKYYLEWKDKKAADARADALNTAVEKLAKATEESNKVLSTLHFQQDRSGDYLHQLVLRSSGTMDKETSLRLIDKFFGDLSRDVISIFTYSLENNGYAERPDFIRDRVKTQIAQSIESQRTALSFFKLGIELDSFFEMRKRDGKERFVLADDLWAVVEPLYSSKQPLPARVEEMRLSTQNMIRDFLTKSKRAATPIALDEV